MNFNNQSSNGLWKQTGPELFRIVMIMAEENGGADRVVVVLLFYVYNKQLYGHVGTVT